MMQRTKIIAEDSREAMARIMRECGEDAVILSTRKVAGGIEIIAGHPAKMRSTDYEIGEESVSVSSSSALNDRKSAFAELLKESARAPEFKRQAVPEFAAASSAAPKQPAKEQLRIDALEQQVREIKAMLGSELMLGGLKQAGASPALISVFLAQADAVSCTDPDRRFAAFLAGRILHKNAPSLTDGPRVVVTLGPSGSGKTTFLAQLAARAKMAAPDEKITFVNADTSKMGAAEQLRAFGRILDVPVIDIEQATELAQLSKNSGRRMSLFIDMPSSLVESSALMAVLEENAANLPPILRYGAIASNLSVETIERMMDRYPRLDALALTKLDEAPVSLMTLSLLSLRGPGIAYLASTAHLVKGLIEPDLAMLEDVIHSSLVGSGSEPLN
jgi:flagellar biosynthesis protein FlhF